MGYYFRCTSALLPPYFRKYEAENYFTSAFSGVPPVYFRHFRLFTRLLPPAEVTCVLFQTPCFIDLRLDGCLELVLVCMVVSPYLIAEPTDVAWQWLPYTFAERAESIVEPLLQCSVTFMYHCCVPMLVHLAHG